MRARRLFACLMLAGVGLAAPAFASCDTVRFQCTNHCQMGPSLFGGISGGALGGLERGDCENSCSSKYRVCMEAFYKTPEGRIALKKAEQEDKDEDAQVARNLADAKAAEKANADRIHGILRKEFGLYMAYYKAHPDVVGYQWAIDAGLGPGTDAIVTTEIPMRSYFGEVYNWIRKPSADLYYTNADKTEIAGPYSQILKPGQRVHITGVGIAGSLDVSLGGKGFSEGEVIASALRPATSSDIKPDYWSQ